MTHAIWSLLIYKPKPIVYIKNSSIEIPSKYMTYLWLAKKPQNIFLELDVDGLPPALSQRIMMKRLWVFNDQDKHEWSCCVHYVIV